jgi:hypothetical protein
MKENKMITADLINKLIEKCNKAQEELKQYSEPYLSGSKEVDSIISGIINSSSRYASFIPIITPSILSKIENKIELNFEVAERVNYNGLSINLRISNLNVKLEDDINDNYGDFVGDKFYGELSSYLGNFLVLSITGVNPTQEVLDFVLSDSFSTNILSDENKVFIFSNYEKYLKFINDPLNSDGLFDDTIIEYEVEYDEWSS